VIGGAFDPLTRRSAGDLAPQLGWRCLHLGTGGGRVARSPADQVGDTRQIVASERDTSLLRDINHPRLILGADVAGIPTSPRMLSSI
jgi:hypothetical protein